MPSTAPIQARGIAARGPSRAAARGRPDPATSAAWAELATRAPGSAHRTRLLSFDASMDTARIEGLAGKVLEGKYRLDAIIGRGGMAVVFAATHLGLERQVAIKMLATEHDGRADLAARMVREAKTAGSFGHPNIVQVTDLGWHDGTPFVVMEYLHGTTLSTLLAQRGPMPPSRAVPIVLDVLDALAAVHRRGVVHRDIKPQNVMLVRDHAGQPVVKVLDFGISKVVVDDGSLTQTGAVIGTPAHMAPEQALGEPACARADLFAVGSLLYTLLVGESPYQAHNSTATLARLLDGRYEPAGRRVASVGPRLEAVLATALARRPADRFADAAAMREALLACRDEYEHAPHRPREGPRSVPLANAAVAQPVAPAPRNPAAAPHVDARFAPPPVQRLALDEVLERPRPAAAGTRRAAGSPGWRPPLRPIAWSLAAVVLVVVGWREREALRRFAGETRDAFAALLGDAREPKDDTAGGSRRR